ncbi:restriction endonuclease subunit S [Lactiplantibacillus pentosus]|uniref:restriction endonuclease subunit S n=1 Tax=Lactiplantibacillus pentosus TaxID=1589 RepID=UPI001CFFF0F4|nr:restriction endonuclease subunit S [Lactiplantibacillus pentosus]MCB5223206.1 restriction endonuclease subunit S [Lactiplantibacillus pentosus]
MKDNQAKYPQLRFKGFTDPWEQRKLIEVADYRNGKAHEKDISENGDYIVVNSKFVSTNGAVKKFSDELIAPLKKGELAFVLSDVPNGRAIARTFLIDEDDKYSLNQRIAGITPHSDTNSYFLHSLMNRHHYFLRFDDGAGQTNLSKKEVENWTELYPSIEEQDKIGSFFKQLDDTITLHQRKLSDLFIKGGSGGTPKSTNKAFYDGDIPFLGISDITKSNGFINNTEKHISSDGLNSSAAWIVSKGAISLAMYASVGKLAILNIDAATSQAFYNMIFDDYDLRDLVYQRLNKANELSEWNKLISTGTQSNLNADKVKNFQMYLPKNHDEIKLINTFFKQIDNTIARQQRKLEKLQELKKGYLQKMFC